MELTAESLGLLLGRCLLGYYVVGSVLAATVSAWQEYKIWSPKVLPTLSLFGFCKVFLFNLAWFAICFVGSIFILLKWILSLGRSDIARDGNRLAEATAAKVVLNMFVGPVETKGLENLPPEDTVPAPVYIANHESQIDVGSVYYIERRFKWIAKQSVLFLPGVGLLMWLSDHVLIKRTGKNRKSISNLFEKSDAAVQSGVPMLIFPQGTRRIAERRTFKDGAFKIAIENQCDLVPISIGIPRNVWNTYYPLNLLWGGETKPITITVHPPIKVSNKDDREALKTKCFDKIYSILEPMPSGESKKKA